MKKKMIALGVVVSSLVFGNMLKPKDRVIHAQTLPYNLVVTWDAPVGLSGTTTYNCFLDNVKMTPAPVTGLTCSFPVNTTGPHSVGVTSVNDLFVPNEGLPEVIAFVLQSPKKVTNVKVR